MDLLTPLIIGVVVIALSPLLARRSGVAGPLLLVAVGLVASLFLPPFAVDPEIILIGILPPLLYASAVRIPAVEFRRDALPITGMAVLLVVISALALGAFFFLLIPGLDFALAVALGAILSPTDAVATAIASRLGISPRVLTMLEGESLLNDATALVLLRSSVAAAAAGFSLWATVGTFVIGVAVAVAIGILIGKLNLWMRRLIDNAAAATALSLVVPFAAYVPTEHLGGSGLVAAVVAGIVTGQGSSRWFTAEERVSDRATWRTVEFMLEGAVFLIMGLELRDIVGTTLADDKLWLAIGLALGALAIVLLVRAGFITVLLAGLRMRARPGRLQRLTKLQERVDRKHPQGGSPVRARLTRAINDIDYYQATPLDAKQGTILVWAGMRGVVTLAAAQTLPTDTPSRSLLVLVAFLVAVISLMVQGLTLPAVIRGLKLPSEDARVPRDERRRIDDELRAAAQHRLASANLTDSQGKPFPPELIERIATQVVAPPPGKKSLGTPQQRDLRLEILDAMRARLSMISRSGEYSTAALRQALLRLDANELTLDVWREEYLLNDPLPPKDSAPEL